MSLLALERVRARELRDMIGVIGGWRGGRGGEMLLMADVRGEGLREGVEMCDVCQASRVSVPEMDDGQEGEKRPF